jgi:hypothetical protein
MRRSQSRSSLRTFASKRAEGLVEQQDLRFDGQRARQRHALPLPPGELLGIHLREGIQLHKVQQLQHAFADIAARSPQFLDCTRSPKATFSKIVM